LFQGVAGSARAITFGQAKDPAQAELLVRGVGDQIDKVVEAASEMAAQDNADVACRLFSGELAGLAFGVARAAPTSMRLTPRDCQRARIPAGGVARRRLNRHAEKPPGDHYPHPWLSFIGVLIRGHGTNAPACGLS